MQWRHRRKGVDCTLPTSCHRFQTLHELQKALNWKRDNVKCYQPSHLTGAYFKSDFADVSKNEN